MGTNYYLIKKCNKEEFDKYKHYNDDFCSGDDYKELENGYVYCNRYYSSIEELEECLALTLHIGKSSYGWHFSLCIYPDLGIKDLGDWKKLFSEYEIYNEYSDLVSAEEMIDIIANRFNKDFLELGQEAYEANVVEHHNGLCPTLHTTPVKDYDEYLDRNHAERGINGLLAHKWGAYIRTDGTYDLTTEYNFC